MHIEQTAVTDVCEESRSIVKWVPVHAMKACGAIELWLRSFLTSALDWVSGQLHDPAALPQEEPLVTIGYGTGWAAESVWMLRRDKYFAPAGNRTTTSPTSSP
jgi:hypothetical protein